MNIKYDAIPVLRLVVPPKPTVKHLSTKVLMALGDPSPGRKSVSTSNFKIASLARMAETHTMIIDNFHHVLAEESRSMQHVADWFVSLAHRCNIVLVIPDLDSTNNLPISLLSLAMRHQLVRSTSKVNFQKRRS